MTSIRAIINRRNKEAHLGQSFIICSSQCIQVLRIDKAYDLCRPFREQQCRADGYSPRDDIPNKLVVEHILSDGNEDGPAEGLSEDDDCGAFGDLLF